ncbi:MULTISPECIES: Na+/H+ antiporter [unclassified Bradyrhizobium]|uniref:Na+/H+ antiporter n=1 Tax=unclassified Bradyrhizobium TaxID=2631580 RepID=UPI00247A192E|nr:MULTISPECIES: Na+/H+ antiporter [unclassified Bradyrhizobium]WGR73136.1 Na+/H+ antiporter [Bradyrhizobium sp. ISRA426]WGR77976.1 Na+/H+ antiporter [Bradyrhizobium sp. ISRA430]WGR88377.1 Na+/H+ antiporter [Bradyrhizobium sp. ISRA432]
MTPQSRFEILLVLLMIAVVLETLASRLRLPRASVLMTGGIAIALVPGLPGIEFDPDLVMVLFLPPLLLASAYFTVWTDFRANLRIIFQLATGAVVLTTVVVAVVAHWLKPELPWSVCFALGAILSPPDAVAAKAVLKRFPLPRRVVVLLEGESLVNDASGLVLLQLAVTAAMTGTFGIGQASMTFLYVAMAGIGIGLMLGYLSASIARLLADARLTVIWTFLLAWASYIIAEAAGASGVLSTVACGLILGRHQHRTWSAAARTQARAVWDVAEFVMESLLFIIIGLSLRGVVERAGGQWRTIVDLLPAIAAILAALILSRAAWIFPATYRALVPSLRRRDPYPPATIPALMSWAGMRGVVSLAAALGLPADLPGRDFVLIVTFGVIAGTIFVLGGTLTPLARAIAGRDFVLEQAPTLTESDLRLRIAEAELRAVRDHSHNLNGAHADRIIAQYEWRAKVARDQGANSNRNDHVGGEHARAVLSAVTAARKELLDLFQEGLVHDSLLHQFEEELDLEELSARKITARGDY